MMQRSLFSASSLTVTQLSFYLRQLLESDEILRDVWVEGEISNLSRPASGHVYFSLKDSTASLRCVVWKSSVLRIRTPLQNGLAIEAHGAISVYERDGNYQLYIDSVRPAGEGLLYQEFLRLKASLEEEGLFDEARKRPIPSMPRQIGIVTSSTGAALQDMLNTLRERYPLVKVTLAPTAVQGDGAPLEIVAALEKLNRLAKPDVILLARGGGSLEDLWAFNDERVVRAVAASAAPVITGVGHETDFTLADFAADKRAPTPTGAAVLATPEKTELFSALADICYRLENAVKDRAEVDRRMLLDLSSRLRRASPLWKIQNDQQRLDILTIRLQGAASHTLSLYQARLSGVLHHLQSLNPLSILERGYAVVSTSQGELVRKVRQVEVGESLQILFSDGALLTKVTKKSV